MNRMIAGDATWEENLAIGFENPVDGLKGIGKGTVNGVSDLAEIAAKGAVYADAFGDTVTAGVADFVGLDGVAAAFDGMAGLKNEFAAAIDVPEFDLTNRAQQGGAVMGTIIDIGLGGKGLITGAAKLAAKNAPMLSSNALEGIERATPELIEAVSLRRSVTIAKPGSEELRMLDYFGAEASVNTSIDGVKNGSIVLRENPSKAAVLEEFLH
jgi:hypothetical protein